jgi:phospholipase D1/2
VLTLLAAVKTFDDYDKFLPPKGIRSGHIYDRMIPPQEIRQKLDQIKGHLVWMPLEFLKDAPMAETGMLHLNSRLYITFLWYVTNGKTGLQVNSWTESIYT